MSIKVNRCRQGKRIIFRNGKRRRRIRNIKLERMDGRRRDSMPLGAFQSLVVLFELLSCNSSMLRSIWGSFSLISNKSQLKISPFFHKNHIHEFRNQLESRVEAANLFQQCNQTQAKR